MNRERVTILGSTGSIGVQTLDIIQRYPERFQVASLVAHSRWEQLAKQAREFNAESVVIGDERHYEALKAALADTNIKVMAGSEAINHVAESYRSDTLVNALVGYAGLHPTLLAIESGKRIALANKETLVVLISQSGETADTLAALRDAKAKGARVLAVVNVVGSSIARGAKNVLYTKAGPEIAVATTKAYSAQITLLALIALNIADKKKNVEMKQILQDIKSLPVYMEQVIDRDYSEMAQGIYKKEDLYFIGRGIDYALSMEGSLKLKEISYIHSEAYAAGELKHGTISLIDEGTPVISVATDEELFEKTISNTDYYLNYDYYNLGNHDFN